MRILSIYYLLLFTYFNILYKYVFRIQNYIICIKYKKFTHTNPLQKYPSQAKKNLVLRPLIIPRPNIVHIINNQNVSH